MSPTTFCFLLRPLLANPTRYQNSTGKHSKDVILQDLKSAVVLDPTYGESAAVEDNHFDNLRQDEGFKSIVQ